MILLSYLINIFFISAELSFMEYNFINKIEKNFNKKIQYMIFDYIHSFLIFINYGFPIFILYNLFFFYDKSDILLLIIIFNLIWLIVFTSYFLYDDCIFLKICRNIIPETHKYRFIDPSERLFYIFSQKKYELNKIKNKNNHNRFNNSLTLNIIFLILINITVLYFIL